QVAAKRFEGGCLDFALLFLRRFFGRGFARSAFFLRSKVGIEFFQNLLPRLFDVHVEVLEDAGGNAVAFAKESEQDMFGADEIMVETVGFLAREREDLLRPWCEVVHCFIAHTSKCNHFSCLSNPGAGGGGLAIGRLTCLRRSRTMSARSKSRSSAESFS